MFVAIVIMFIGLVVDNPRKNAYDLGYLSNVVIFIVFSVCLLFYPKYETRFFRVIIILMAMGYFNILFYVYPQTSSTFIFLWLIPALPILFFDKKLFYYTFFLNAVLVSITFGYILFIDKGQNFSHINIDITGNIINFVGSQIILYYIFFLTNVQMENQREYFEEAQNAERLKTTGQLAAAVAHEIRNPLTVVKGFLQFYVELEDFNQKNKRNFSLMIDELDAAEQVISQFLSISKPDKEKKLDTVEVKSVLDDVTELLKTYGLVNNNPIQLEVQANSYVSINSLEFKQLLINLIKNAIEASPHGRAVIVQVKRTRDGVSILVMDRGSGMSEEELASLGTPFYSLKSKGTGLGLMICYNIVEKYNGKIQFVSVEGEGTTVTLQFPFAEE